jgi:hypothetical protein
VRGLLQEIPNPIHNYPLGLYALANAYIDTDHSKNNLKIRSIIRDGWADIPLSYEQVKYASPNAHLGFKITRKFFQLVG